MAFWRNPVEQIVAKIEARDFEEMREALVGWDHQYDQIGEGQFDGELLYSQLGELQISRNLWGRRIHYQGTSPQGTLGLAVTLHQRDDAHWMGVGAGHDDVIIQKSGAEADYISSAEWDALVFAIPATAFAQLASDLGGGDPESISDLHGVARLTPEACNRIRSLGLAYCSILERSIEHPATSALLPPMAQNLVSTTVRELVAAWPSRFEKPDLNRRRQIVRQAEDCIAGCEDYPVRIENVCRALGVSERTLYYSFADTVGMTPVHWLRIQRLNQVHRVLKSADPAETMVKQIAIEKGFLHLGHFSANYKQLFGEAPSETLRR
jgi:AraC family ethanolamine operon transcriptional activator